MKRNRSPQLLLFLPQMRTTELPAFRPHSGALGQEHKPRPQMGRNDCFLTLDQEAHLCFLNGHCWGCCSSNSIIHTSGFAAAYKGISSFPACIFIYFKKPMYLCFYCCRVLLLKQCFACAFMHHPSHLLLKELYEETNLQRCE